MAWAIIKGSSNCTRDREGLYFRPEITHRVERLPIKDIPDTLHIKWEARDDDDEVLYYGRMDEKTYSDDLCAIFDWCESDVGSTQLWCKRPEQVEWECVIS